MALHHLKCDRGPFDAVWNGLKGFEVRRNDRAFALADILTLRETVNDAQSMASGAPLKYTGRFINAHVTWIVFGPRYGIAEGWCVMSIAMLARATDSVPSGEVRG